MSENEPTYGRERWDASRVRRLRGHLGDTQREFAERLGTRQQTVSEWETGASSPRAMARRLLGMVAEERGFYSTKAGSPAEAADRPSIDGAAADQAGAPGA